jgi:hypothetical protein
MTEFRNFRKVMNICKLIGIKKAIKSFLEWYYERNKKLFPACLSIYIYAVVGTLLAVWKITWKNSLFASSFSHWIFLVHPKYRKRFYNCMEKHRKCFLNITLLSKTILLQTTQQCFFLFLLTKIFFFSLLFSF